MTIKNEYKTEDILALIDATFDGEEMISSSSLANIRRDEMIRWNEQATILNQIYNDPDETDKIPTTGTSNRTYPIKFVHELLIHNIPRIRKITKSKKQPSAIVNDIDVEMNYYGDQFLTDFEQYKEGADIYLNNVGLQLDTAINSFNTMTKVMEQISGYRINKHKIAQDTQGENFNLNNFQDYIEKSDN